MSWPPSWGHRTPPDAEEPLVITAPGEESGTYDTFVELVIADISEERLGEDNDFTRADYNASANDNVIVQGITENPTSLGWVGFAFFEENQDVLKAIEVDSGESGCVAPSADTIASFEYPLSRPLFIYVKTNDLGSRADLTAFVDFYLSDEGLAFVSDAGYVQLPAEDIEATRGRRGTAPRADDTIRGRARARPLVLTSIQTTYGHSRAAAGNNDRPDR